jgi:uncharacterized membrane protein YeiH
MVIPHLLDFLGVAVSAVSGALAAGRKSLDLLGVIVIATVTAIGGGTLRDLLLDRRPIFWIGDTSYLAVIFFAAILTVLYTYRFRPPARGLVIADALALSLFTLSGAQIAEGTGHYGVVAAIMGTLTGVAGGVLRDVLTAEIPMILRPGRLYATASIVGVTVYLLMEHVIDRTAAALLGMACITTLRIAGIIWEIKLPAYRLPED